jgi:N-acetylglucosamine-6-phosphate deacetylase
MGLIDIHTHGMDGFDTRTASRKSVLEMARLYGRAGVECIVPTIYPAAVETMRTHMEAVGAAMELQGSSGYASGAAARILGVNLEGPFLNPARGGALDAGSFLLPDEKLLKALVSGFESIIRIISVAPELDGATALIEAICGMGITVSMGHSDATWKEAEVGYRAGARGVTHLFNAMRGLHHREPGLAGFALLHPDVYVEVIADPFHLHPAVLDMIFRLKAHERIIIVSDTVKESMAAPSPERIKDGIKDGIGGAAPRANKDAGGTLQGGCMALPRAVKRLVEMGYGEAAVGACASENPARYLGMTE